MHEKDPTFPEPSPNGLSIRHSHESNRFSFARHDDRTPTILVEGQSWYEPSIVSDGGHDYPDDEEKHDEEQQEDEDGDVEQKLSVKALIPVTVALCAALFCMSLDSTILATAIPKITSEFDSLDDVAWYGSSYLFTTCAVQLMFGKLYTFYSSKWVFMAGMLLFEVGSAVCGAAPSSTALIIGRAIAGLGGAGLFSGALIIINSTVPLRVRPIYLGIVSSMHAIATVAGPILGGVFTDRMTWRWCFYINLPFGAFAVILIVACLPCNAKLLSRPSLKEQIKQIDLPGTAVLAPSIICLILALQWGGEKYPWGDARVVALFVVAAVLFATFIGIQFLQGERATVPMRMMKNRNIWGAVWYGSFLNAAMFIITYYLPIWFQAVKGLSAETSGIYTIPSMAGLVVFAIIGGVLASTIGYYTPFIIISSVITAIGTGMLSTFKPDSGIAYWFGYQVILAAGMGLGAQNMFLVCSTAVPKSEMAIATSILTFCQVLASAIMLPVGQSVFQNQLLANFRSMIPSVNAELVVASGATGFRKLFTAAQLPTALNAYNKSIMQTFYVAVATSAISFVGPLFMEWLSLKKVESEQKAQNKSEKEKKKQSTMFNRNSMLMLDRRSMIALQNVDSNGRKTRYDGSQVELTPMSEQGAPFRWDK